MKILIVDNDPKAIRLIKKIVREVLPTTECTSLRADEDFQAELQRDNYDFILADANLFKDQPYSAFLRQIKAKWPRKPVVFIAKGCIREQVQSLLQLAIAGNREYTVRFRAISKLTSDFTFSHLVEPDGRLINEWFSGALKKLTGYRADEISFTRDNLPNFILVGDRDLAKQKIARALSGEQTECTVRIETKTGQVRWLQYLIKPVWDRKLNRVTRLYGAARDITAQRQAAAALSESENKFRVLAETAPAAIFIYRGTKFIYVNNASESITGYSRAEAMEMNIWDIVAPEFRQIVKERAAARLSGKAPPPRYELKIIRKDGGEVWVDLAAGLIEFEGESAVLATAFDITERKRSEMALKSRREAVRRAYVDVLSAVTGGKLIIMTDDELAAALGRPVGREVMVDKKKGLKAARDLIGRELRRAALDEVAVHNMVLAASEALTNAVKHAAAGNARIYRTETSLQIKVTDFGRGIDFSILPKAALTAGYSTTMSLGFGFTIMLEFSSRLLLATRPGQTSVVLEISKAPGRVALTA